MMTMRTDRRQAMNKSVKVVFLPDAKKLQGVSRTFLERAYEVWKEAKTDKPLISNYMGGELHVVTVREGGKLFQMVFTEKDVPLLPQHLQDDLRRTQAGKPIVSGQFTGHLKPL